MNVTLGKTEFTPEEIDDLRDRLRGYKETAKLSWSDLSKVTDIPTGTLSAWVPGSYNNGRIAETHEIAGKVHRFFLSMTEKAALESVMPTEPDFQLTPSALRMMKCLAIAQLGDMAMISSPPGIGKTSAVDQYAATRSRVFKMTAAPSSRGVPTVLIAILAAMGEQGAKGTPQVLSARVRTRVRDAGALIVIDEAQHLSAQALDEIRSIHDETGCGVALVGDETLITNLKAYPQLYSRLGIRHSQPRPLPDDITVIAEAWGVRKGPELAYLQEAGRKGGGIRTVNKTMKLALHQARAGGAPLEVGDLRDAWAQRGWDEK